MKRIAMLALALMLCTCAAAVEDAFRSFDLGGIEYQVPSGWSYKYSEEYDMHYHLETMEPWNSRSLTVQMFTDAISDETDATAFFASFADGMAGEGDMERIAIDPGNLNNYPSSAFVVHFSAEDLGYEMDSLNFIFWDGNQLYLFVYSNPTVSIESAMDEFTEMLSEIVSEVETNRTSECTPEWMAEEMCSWSNDSFLVKAEYHKDMDVLTCVLQSMNITSRSWNVTTAAVQEQYRDSFVNIVKSAKDSLDGMGCEFTTLISTFRLCDGNAVYMMIDDADFTSMIAE